MLALLLRALRWRRGASLAVLLVATVAAGAATLGPLYVRSAEESFLLEQVARAVTAPSSTDVELSATSVGQPGTGPFPPPGVRPSGPNALLDAMTRELSSAAELAPWFGPVGGWITVAPVAVKAADGSELGDARLSYHPGPCQGVTLVAGRCPSAAGEAMVSARLLADAKLQLGATLQVDFAAPPAVQADGTSPGPDLRKVTVVGTYAPGSAQLAVWGSRLPTELQRKGLEQVILDEILLDSAGIQRTSTEFRVTVFRLLRSDLTRLEDVDAAGAAAAAAQARITSNEAAAIRKSPRTQPVWVAKANLPGFLADRAGDRAQLRTTSLAVTGQLLVLSWFVLFVVVAATTDERAAEVALAKLRGAGPWRTLALGLAETATLLVLAAPLGLLAALGLDALLVNALPLPRTSARLDATTWLAAGVGLLGAVVSAALALRRMLTTPVLEELRRTGGTRAALARTIAVDAATLGIAAEGVYLLSTGNDDPVALASPGLLALAAGLLTVRVLPLIARLAVRWTAARRDVAAFLAVRNVARRPGGSRLVVLLTIAAALGVFSISSWTVSRDVRVDQARLEVGAPTVLHVGAQSPGVLAAAVDRADPQARWAMAAVQVPRTSNGPVLAVQTTRLAAISTWDPQWAGLDAARLTELLHPQRQAPVVVHGRISLQANGYANGSGELPTLSVLIREADGTRLDHDLGPLRRGSATYTADLRRCDTGCDLLALRVRGKAIGTGVSVGGLTLTRIEDAAGAVDAGLTRPAAWRVVQRQQSVGDASEDERNATPGPDGLAVTFSGLIANDDVVVEVADHAAIPSAVTGSARRVDVVSGSTENYYDSSLAGASTLVRKVATGDLPRVGREGVLLDLDDVVAADPTVPDGVDYQVWLAAGAPATVKDSLTASGLQLIRTETVADRLATLNRDAPSLALLFTVTAALIAVVLAVGTVIAMSYVGGRRRSYEFAALRSLGAGTRMLVRAGRREQVGLVTLGAIVGCAVGLAATTATLRALPGVTLAGTAPVEHVPRLSTVLPAVLVALLVVAVAADLGSRRVVSAATTDLLRENQA